MAKINFGSSPVAPTEPLEKLFTVILKYPKLIKGLEITIDVPKDDVKQAVIDMSDILEDLQEDI